jgi:hypothetical protein
VGAATAVPFRFTVQGMPQITKAIQLPDTTEGGRQGGGLLLNNFGRGNRDDVMRSNDTSIIQALSLMNDPNITSRAKRLNNSTVQQILATTTDPATIVDRLYLASLSRYPTAAEKTASVDYLRAGTLAERTEDLQYVLLNSVEFLFV